MSRAGRLLLSLLGCAFAMTLPGCPKPRSPIRVVSTSRRAPPRAEPGRVVAIVAPNGSRRHVWAAPGDLLVLARELPFPFKYESGTTLRWQLHRAIVRVNGRVAAVDLSSTPPGQMAAQVRIAKRAGARCAFWQGSRVPKAEAIRSLAKLPPGCLGIRVHHLRALPPSELRRLLPLRAHIHHLDVMLVLRAMRLLSRFSAVRMLLLRESSQDTEPNPRMDKAQWASVSRLLRLQHLRSEHEGTAKELLSGLRRLRRLRRLEVPNTDLARALGELVKRPKLISVMGRLYEPGSAAHRKPAWPRQRGLRELRLPAENNWSGQPAMDWLEGLGSLRILTLGVEIPYDKLKAFKRLEVLTLGAATAKRRRLPRLERLRALTIAGYPTVELPRLPSLRRLTLVGAELKGAYARMLGRYKRLEAFHCPGRCTVSHAALIALGSLERLREVTMSPRAQLTSAGVQALARARNLRRLAVAGRGIDDAAATQLGKLRRLQSLRLHDTSITDAGLAKLLKGRGLRRLSLGGAKITSAGVGRLASHSQLTHLDISGTLVDDKALSTLAALKKLRWLSLEGTEITGSALSELVALTALRHLNLAHAPVQAGVIAKHGLPPGLTHLDLSAVPLTPGDLQSLVRLAGLSHLRLNSCMLTRKHLVQLRKLPRLQILNLAVAIMRDADLEVLGTYPVLERVNLRGSATFEGVLKFRKKYPHLSWR